MSCLIVIHSSVLAGRMVFSGVRFKAHEAGDQITPFFLVFLIFFLANVLVVVAGYVAADYAGVVELEIKFLPAVVALGNGNPDNVTPAACAIR